MLESQSFSDVRLWPRGVDLSQFGPSKRSASMRALWGVGEAPVANAAPMFVAKFNTGIHHSGRKTSLPLTPPASPIVTAAEQTTAEPEPMSTSHDAFPSRIVLLYVGRVSWEKNLILLLHAYGRMVDHMPLGSVLPKLVFVGDGPARAELESICVERNYDATFMGHRSGEELAQCYASADVFAFPSFTETFGQVVLEALASGLVSASSVHSKPQPVIGLDAEGTRDLVSHGSTGLLLPLPSGAVDKTQNPSRTWPSICRDPTHHLFTVCVDKYAQLLARATTAHAERSAMGARASTEGIRGFTWWDAMERCVDGYREAIGRARESRQVHVRVGGEEDTSFSSRDSSPRISRVNRALSSRLARRDVSRRPESSSAMASQLTTKPLPRRRRLLRKSYDPAETLWHLKNLAKAVLVAVVFWWIWKRHLASVGREFGWDEVMFQPTA